MTDEVIRADVPSGANKVLDHMTRTLLTFNLQQGQQHTTVDLPEEGSTEWMMWHTIARVALVAYTGHMEGQPHRYLSTGCLHGEHGYCQSNTGSQGQKIPAVCKFCQAGCVCPCHESAPAPGAVAVVERIVNPRAVEEHEKFMARLLSDGKWCGSEPPGGAGAEWTAEDGTTGVWGDCDCTRPKGHQGDHSCDPCTQRFGAPTWTSAKPMENKEAKTA